MRSRVLSSRSPVVLLAALATLPACNTIFGIEPGTRASSGSGGSTGEAGGDATTSGGAPASSTGGGGGAARRRVQGIHERSRQGDLRRQADARRSAPVELEVPGRFLL
ncbi:hypothetical protein [Sorangium sp. So ce513]|uniref:hypothetical protein n=1 Tax=Sorangium sp. So ce513 TaxID=3133315 RepID=UPI003F627F59